MVPQDFPRYNMKEMLKIQRPNIQGFEFMSTGCKTINKIKRVSLKKVRFYARQCQKTSWGQAVPSCAKLKTARNNYSLDVSFESYAKNAIHLGMALLSEIKLADSVHAPPPSN